MFIKNVTSILVLDFGKWNFLGYVVEIMISTSVLCVLVYCFSIILKQWTLVSCDYAVEKVLIDLACLDEIFTDFDSAPFLIYSSTWNKICTDPPLSIIFINGITNYLPVNVQLILPSIFVFIQLCLATILWVSTALLHYEQLTAIHSLDHQQDHHDPVWIF